MKRLSIKFKKEDCWVGVYWNSLNIWICIIPFFPIHILRESICKGCGKRIKGEYGNMGWHDDKKWIKYSRYSDELVTCWKNKKINDIVDEECS